MRNIQTTINIVHALHHFSWCIMNVKKMRRAEKLSVGFFLMYIMYVDFGWLPTDWNTEKCLYESRKLELMLNV